MVEDGHAKINSYSPNLPDGAYQISGHDDDSYHSLSVGISRRDEETPDAPKPREGD
jgi:hypothetical protein